ncbi:MAG TPA: 4-hydroxy-tetrahydrodipicolinate synthase [Herbaspirillum sp.]|jgi:4-hydroxy-tetrahydrodipicolinate synthase
MSSSHPALLSSNRVFGRSEDVNGTAPLPHGSLVALVTPMFPDGGIDIGRFCTLIDWHIAEGTNGIVVMGSTGESATVSTDEHVELIRIAIDHAQGRVPVIAGAGANSTDEAIELTAHARRAGAAACLSVVPYYNKPTQEGLYRHFRSIAETVDIPLILYDVPSRTIVGMDIDTIARLSQIPGIVGLKDATGDIGRAALVFNAVDSDFSVYSGDDASAAALMLLGAHGNISVTANVAPRLMAQLCDAARNGDVGIVRDLNRRMSWLSRALFLESNPIPVKWALAQMGMIEAGCRLPLTALSARHHDAVRQALLNAGVGISGLIPN